MPQVQSQVRPPHAYLRPLRGPRCCCSVLLSSRASHPSRSSLQARGAPGLSQPIRCRCKRVPVSLLPPFAAPPAYRPAESIRGISKCGMPRQMFPTPIQIHRQPAYLWTRALDLPATRPSSNSAWPLLLRHMLFPPSPAPATCQPSWLLLQIAPSCGLGRCPTCILS